MYPSAQTPVFRDLNLSVAPAKITALVARSGQGKTTLFRLMLGFYPPRSGKIVLGGYRDSVFTTASLRRHVGMMSQFPAFFHDTVRENFRIAKEHATDSEIRALCESTGLWEILERSAGSNPLDREFAGGAFLSGGEKKLFALTRCLLREPSFLFLDEPSTGMDNERKYDLIPRMRSACAGKTVIVVEHDIPWLIQFCDEVAELEGGRIVRQGPPVKLLRDPGLLRDLYERVRPGVGADWSIRNGK
jgi:ABC-type multidrug transport system fused ATPase/permease subunit